MLHMQHTGRTVRHNSKPPTEELMAVRMVKIRVVDYKPIDTPEPSMFPAIAAGRKSQGVCKNAG